VHPAGALLSSGMSSPGPDLPTDPEELRAFALALQAELYAKTLTIEKLKAQLAVLRRARFGRSSEKLDHDIEQLELLIGELEESEAESQARTAAVTRSPRTPPTAPAKGRQPLPDHLPREVVRHEAPCACPQCGGTVFSRLGEDEREVLEYVPSHFKVIRHVRPKLSCRACETIVQAPMPSLPIERGRPGPRLLAHVAVAKYADHLPLYRQSEIYARSGLDLDRSTLADWVGQMNFLLGPLAVAIGRHARAGPVVHADDTPVPVLDPGRGRTKTGRLWTLVRDERPWGGPAPPAAFYLYSPDRKGEHAEALLGACRGHLHADGYAGFNTLYAPDPKTQIPRLTEVACWAHARRKVYEVHVATGSAAAQLILERMSALFEIEADIRGRSPEARLEARRGRSVPLLADLAALMDRTLARISGKSSLAQAIRYARSRWEALSRFAADGRRDDQQRRRAGDPAPGARAQELPLRRLRYRRRPRRSDVHPDRDRQAERPRPRGLPR
jgi:transposase